MPILRVFEAAPGTRSVNLIYDRLTNPTFIQDRNTWAPAITSRRPGTLGGQQLYTDVTESLSVSVVGATVPAVLANQSLLFQLLDQADAWRLGDPVNPVILEYQPVQSVAVVQSLIVGRGGSGEQHLPVGFDENLDAYIVHSLPVTFQRRGLWLLSRYSPDNLLSNSSAEIQTTGWNARTTSSIAQVSSPSPVLFGTFALQVNAQGINNLEGVDHAAVSLTTGLAYTASVWVSAPVGATLALGVYSTPAAATVATKLFTGTGAWQRVTATFTAASTGNHLVQVYTNGVQALTFSLDGAQLEQNATATDWHPATSEQTASTVSTVQELGVKTGGTFSTTAPFPSPTDVYLNGIPANLTSGATMQSLPAGLLCYTSGPNLPATSNRIAVLEAEALWVFGGPATLTTNADATNYPSGGGVLRYTPTATGSNTDTGNIATGLDPSVRRVQVFATIRSNSPSTTVYTITPITQTNGIDLIGRPQMVNSATVQIVSFGLMVRADGHASIRLRFSTNVVGSTVDVDQVIIVAAESPAEGTIAHDALTFGSGMYGSTAMVSVRHQSLSDIRPQVAVETTTGTYVKQPLSYRGNAFLSTEGQAVIFVWILPNGTRWKARLADNTAFQYTFAAARAVAALTP